METPTLIRTVTAIALCGATALANCNKDESAKLDASGNLEDAQPQNCIPEMSPACTPGSGGSGGAGG